MKLVPVYNAIKPSIDHGGKPSRAAAGMTLQAARSRVDRPCRFCGESSKEHKARYCAAPIRRGWGREAMSTPSK